jgi:hypothetical protein
MLRNTTGISDVFFTWNARPGKAFGILYNTWVGDSGRDEVRYAPQTLCSLANAYQCSVYFVISIHSSGKFLF